VFDGNEREEELPDRALLLAACTRVWAEAEPVKKSIPPVITRVDSLGIGRNAGRTWRNRDGINKKLRTIDAVEITKLPLFASQYTRRNEEKIDSQISISSRLLNVIAVLSASGAVRGGRKESKTRRWPVPHFLYSQLSG
jgi:hypothetical protein